MVGARGGQDSRPVSCSGSDPGTCWQGMRVGDALGWATRKLAASGSETPRLDTEVLLGYVLSLSRTQLYVHWDDPLAEGVVRHYADLILRREAREPVAYLVGERPFFDVDLYVDHRVLIPRPETEHIIDEALSWALRRVGRLLQVVDVGTGSGALAIVLARRLAHAHVWGVDISVDALRVAAGNVQRYNLKERVTMVCGDLLDSLVGPFDLIVANLPYVTRKELDSVASDIVEHEPRLALDGGEDGLDLIRRLLPQVPERLAKPGLLLLEIDHRQAKAVVDMVHGNLPDAEPSLINDYAGLPRIVRAEHKALPR